MIVFRRFVVLRPPRLRLLGEAPFGDPVRCMDAGFDGIVPLCRKGMLFPEPRVGCSVPGGGESE